MTSTQAHLHKILSLYVHLLGDMGAEVITPGKPKIGWRKYSKYFCDSLVLWCLVGESGDADKGKCIGAIKDAFQVLNLTYKDVKVLGQGAIWDDNKDLPQTGIKAFKREHPGEAPRYLSVKVTLRDLPFVDVLSLLPSILDNLKESHIYLHDMDIASDCHYVTTRRILQDYLKSIDPDVDIKDDRRKVGDHCLSWYSATHKDQTIRCKVYNKFVQLLESAEVRLSLGSRMEDLVAHPDKAFTSRLLDAKDKGLSRLELSFYGYKIYKYKYYVQVMDATRSLLKDCQTYKVPYESYWKSMVSKIPAMVVVYIPKRHVFAYCHWWNSVTGKMYGSHRGKVKSQEVMTLVANYGFNNRPIYLVEADVEGTISTTLSKYTRAQGCSAITLVAGGHKGLYPYKYHQTVKDFAEVGLVSHENITIAWPKRRIPKEAPPLASIVLQEDSNGNAYIHVSYTAVHVSTFKAGYVVFQIGCKYTIAEVYLHTYRDKASIFVVTTCGLRARCGDSLAGLVERWLGQHPDAEAPLLRFKVKAKYQAKGVHDIRVQ